MADTTYFGIDVSRWQGSIDWNRVKQAGVQFVMIRAAYRGYGDGSLNLDPKAVEYVEGCIRNGIDYGLYIFSQAITQEEARQEADFLIDWCRQKGYKPSYPICIDQEYSGAAGRIGRADKLTADQYRNNVRAFCKRAEERSYYRIIYCSESWYINNHAPVAEDVAAFDYWIAKWSEVSPKISRSFGIWQYSNSGTISGITGRVDLNVANRDYPAIIKDAELNGWKKEAEPEDPPITKGFLIRLLEKLLEWLKGGI